MISYDFSKIKKYWLSFRRNTLIYTIFYNIFFVISIVCLILLNRLTDDTTIAIWSAIIIFVSIIYHILFFKIIIQPQERLLHSVVNIAGNYPSGLKGNFIKDQYLLEIINFLYTLDNSIIKSAKDINDTPQQIVEILQKSPIGIIALKKGEIFFSNKSAPKLDNLLFINQQHPLDWLKKISKNKLTATKKWQRIKTLRDKDIKIYDIEGFFSKTSDIDAIFFFINRTSLYDQDETDLNFIAFAAHELRGPITIIRGYLDLLSEELANNISQEQKELFDRLIVSSNKLSGYINNILNISRIENDKLNFIQTNHSVDEIIDSIHDDITLRAVSQGRKISISVEPNLPNLNIDITGLSEVIINIVDNAVKYSYDGGLIELSARLNSSEKTVEISIRDYGIGIPDNIIENIFNKFYRSHRSRETVAGSGIGLYISQAIIESFGGKITVSSKEGEGSNFTISLPTTKNIKSQNNRIKNHGRIS